MGTFGRSMWLALVAVAALAAAGCSPDPTEAPEAPAPAAVPAASTATAPAARVRSAEALLPALESAADYLDRHQGEDGRFVYRINLDGEVPSPRYTVVRHAGTIYALATYFDFSGREATRRTVLRAARYLKERHLRKVEGREDLLAIFSLPGEESRTAQAEAKLGGCALGLVGLIEAREIDEKVVSLEELRALGRFILFMQQADGKFWSKADEDSSIIEGFESLYYPGEAILALTRLYQHDGDATWLAAAAKGVGYLVRSREGVRELPPDHWLMIATAELLPVYERLADPPLRKEALIEHALALGRTMLERQRRAFSAGRVAGSFTPDNRSTPTATGLEGLLALYRILPADHPFRGELGPAVDHGVGFLLACQVQGGEGRGGFLRALRKIQGETKFNARQAEIRIDYVQHAMSALLEYHRLLRGAETKAAR